jgi:hypothetical protein
VVEVLEATVETADVEQIQAEQRELLVQMVAAAVVDVAVV